MARLYCFLLIFFLFPARFATALDSDSNQPAQFKAQDIEIAGYSLKELDSRVTAIPLAAIVTVFLFLVMQALVTSNEYDIGDEGVNINISFLRQLQDTETQTAKKKQRSN